MKTCPKCGNTLNDDMSFCPICGSNYQELIEAKEKKKKQDEIVQLSSSMSKYVYGYQQAFFEDKFSSMGYCNDWVFKSWVDSGEREDKCSIAHSYRVKNDSHLFFRDERNLQQCAQLYLRKYQIDSYLGCTVSFYDDFVDVNTLDSEIRDIMTEMEIEFGKAYYPRHLETYHYESGDNWRSAEAFYPDYRMCSYPEAIRFLDACKKKSKKISFCGFAGKVACEKCGKEIDPAKYCPFCGEEIKNASSIIYKKGMDVFSSLAKKCLSSEEEKLVDISQEIRKCGRKCIDRKEHFDRYGSKVVLSGTIETIQYAFIQDNMQPKKKNCLQSLFSRWGNREDKSGDDYKKKQEIKKSIKVVYEFIFKHNGIVIIKTVDTYLQAACDELGIEINSVRKIPVNDRKFLDLRYMCYTHYYFKQTLNQFFELNGNLGTQNSSEARFRELNGETNYISSHNTIYFDEANRVIDYLKTKYVLTEIQLVDDFV